MFMWLSNPIKYVKIKVKTRRKYRSHVYILNTLVNLVMTRKSKYILGLVNPRLQTY